TGVRRFPRIDRQCGHHAKEIRLRTIPFRAAAALLGLVAGGFHASYAAAAPRNPWQVDWTRPQPQSVTPWHVTFAPQSEGATAAESAVPLVLDLNFEQQPATQAAPAPRPKAFEYSHGYEVRRKIHVYGSMAMLPLFVTQGILGAKLYDGDFTEGQHTAHQWVGGMILGLFGMNTVTGLWNLKEGWGDPHQKKLRLTHGLLMLAADAGFAATVLTAPSLTDDFSTHSTHRALAYT